MMASFFRVVYKNLVHLLQWTRNVLISLKKEGDKKSWFQQLYGKKIAHIKILAPLWSRKASRKPKASSSKGYLEQFAELLFNCLRLNLHQEGVFNLKTNMFLLEIRPKVYKKSNCLKVILTVELLTIAIIKISFESY